MSGRDFAIDLLKCVALLFIFNAHSEILYPACPWLATGGYIGDALFFFCSGYTLLMDNGSRLCRFDNWYKRRLSRIWPSCLAWAFVSCLCLDKSISVLQAFKGIGWFVTCILMYYIIIWIIGKFFMRHIVGIYVLVIALSLVSMFGYLHLECKDDFMWKFAFFLPVMLTGAIMGRSRRVCCYRFVGNVIMTLILLALFLICIAIGTRLPQYTEAKYCQIVGMPLMLVSMVFAYRTASSDLMKRWSLHVSWKAVVVIGGLCLDFYLVKWTFLTGALNVLFPLNLPLILIYLLLLAYFNRCIGRIIQQTIVAGKADYDWLSIIRLVP